MLKNWSGGKIINRHLMSFLEIKSNLNLSLNLQEKKL